jgi:hypothetical protein
MGSDFEDLLNQYKSNYTQFLSTGNPAYKTAYTNAQEAIDKAILARQDEVEEQKHDMKRFADSYQEGNSELSDAYDSATGLFSHAQEIEDTYRSAKARYAEVEGEPRAILDVATGYAFLMRFGLILVIIPVLLLALYWSPQIMEMISTSTQTIPVAQLIPLKSVRSVSV